MSSTRSTIQLLSAASATRRGFTLLEILVAVGAVALVSVGIAAIFDSVGKTVNSGRRISRNQTIAARVETQMRRDFSQISRDGFLLIRQQVASRLTPPNGSSPFLYAASSKVALSGRDIDVNKATRDRRIDEVLFFAKGSYTSAMEPVSKDYIARSNEAAIYYGHGQRRTDALDEPGATNPNTRKIPRLDYDAAILETAQDAKNSVLGMSANVGGVPNPNQYASEWILIRKPILLIQPSLAHSVREALPADITTGVIPIQLLQDSDVQIALQPAASSIFQRLSRYYPLYEPTQTLIPGREASVALWAYANWNPMPLITGGFTQPSTQRPQIASGMVDVATTDLTEIRSIVTTCPTRPTQINQAYDTANPHNLPVTIDPNRLTYEFPDQAAPAHAPWQFPVGQGRWRNSSPSSESDWLDSSDQGQAVIRMHTWMQNALPNRSDGFSGFYDFANADADPRQPGTRVRCASSWSSRDDVIRVTPAAGGPPPDPLETYFKRRNQLALSAHNFIEHCSEFMVEWSFGLTDPRTNQIIWYGTPFQDQNGAPDSSREMTMYRGDHDSFNPASPPADLLPEQIPYNPFLGMAGLPAQLTANPALIPALDPNSDNAYRVSKHLIYGNHLAFTTSGGFCPPDVTDACLTSHFGYFDPSFDPRKVPITVPAALPGSPSFESLGISSLPWAWPKMVRITVRVADETDPTLEDSFQFVIDLPPTPHP